jgi:hypothetical protein
MIDLLIVIVFYSVMAFIVVSAVAVVAIRGGVIPCPIYLRWLHPRPWTRSTQNIVQVETQQPEKP